MDLVDIIRGLIVIEKEGGYWDFKRQWYESNEDLLHDIICMANNLEGRDAYIIIGIDEENNFKINDVVCDLNRKNTQMLIDFLKDKKFDGGVRPVVNVESLDFDFETIDVIIIKNSLNTPFYLKERFKGLYPYYIYTRVQDTNTPKNRSADIDNVEWLWKKRLGLHLGILERIVLYIQKPEDWGSGTYHDAFKFYKPVPDYVISYDFVEDCTYGNPAYLHSQMGEENVWLKIQIKYHEILLKEFVGVSLDSGRCITPCPDIDGFSVDENPHHDICFHYMDKDSLIYKLNEFFYRHGFTGDSVSARKRFFRVVLLFEDSVERGEFKDYASFNWGRFKEKYLGEINVEHIPQIKGFRNAIILNKMLEEFRKVKLGGV